MSKLFGASILAFALHGSFAKSALADTALEGVATRFQQSVNTMMTYVTPGDVQFLTTEMCEGKETCLGNNPGAPYGALFFPYVPGQPLAPAVNSSIPLEVPGMLPYTQLRRDEAIVILGRMPKGAKYFGITPNLFSRTYLNANEQRVVFAASGDSINPLTLKHFNGFFAVIVTGSQDQESRATGLLRASGIPPSAIQTLVMAEKAPFRLGWEPESDQLGVLLRLGRITDKEAADAYVKNPPIVTFRLTPVRQSSQKMLAPVPFRKMGTGICEGRITANNRCSASIDPNLDSVLEAAAEEIRRREMTLIPNRRFIERGHVAPGSPDLTENTTAGLTTCVPTGLNCLGDNRDTSYSMSAIGTLSGDARDEIIIVGVDHVQTQKTTYFSHSIYDVKSQTGLASIGDGSTVINGVRSIEYFLGRRVKSATEARLYALKISRNCGDNPFCLTVPTSGPLSLPPGALFQVTSRYYLEPATKVKPHEFELVAPRVIRFVPK